MKLKVKSFEERMKELARRERIQGEVDVWQWDPRAYSKPEEVPESHKVYLVKRVKNKLLRNFAIALYDHLCDKTDPVIDYTGTSRVPAQSYSIYIHDIFAYEGVRLGSDTTTPTEYTTYKLVSEIAIDADAKTQSYFDNGIVWTATWNAGKITQQVGEIGLVGYVWSENSDHKTLFGRLASADGAFQPFTPDPTLNLTVNYRIKW